MNKSLIDPALVEAVDNVIREHHPRLAAGGYRDCSCGQNADERGSLERHIARLLPGTDIERDGPEFTAVVVQSLRTHTPPVYVGGVPNDRSEAVADGVMLVLRAGTGATRHEASADPTTPTDLP